MTVSPNERDAGQEDSSERVPLTPPPALGEALGGGMAKAIRAGAEGESVTAAGLLATLGGWRGVVESVVPALLYVLIFVFTHDARLAAIVPGALAVIMLIIRLVRRETLVSALSGVLGVGVAVLVTLITGRGVDYFLTGFITNAVWSVGLLISILVGWPALGLVIGLLRGDLSGWRRDPATRRTATLLTLLWLALFVARLAVQLPMYLNDQVGALGVARIVMGVPLFAVVIAITWFSMRRHTLSSDEEPSKNVENTGENTPGA